MGALLLCTALLTDCQEHKSPERAEEHARESAPSPASSRPLLPPEAEGSLAAPERDLRAEYDRCLAEITRVTAAPRLSGTPELDARRARLLASVKGEPVLFVRAPSNEQSEDKDVEFYRSWLSRTERPSSVLAQLLDAFKANPAHGRATILRDGYLYAEDLKHAAPLVRILRAEHLFNEPEIWIQRGASVKRAVRDGKRYVHSDGAEEGKPVSLVLFDRVGVGSVPPALHRDVRSLRDQIHFTRMKVRHLTEDHVVADLSYDAHIVPTLLAARGARLDVACEAIDPEVNEAVIRMRERGARRVRAVHQLKRAIVEQLEDRLPFDEPRNEVGQEDGKLRPSFVSAYRRGLLVYQHREDDYPVFDARGRPLVPQVCMDFLLDTIERASGSWFRPRGEPRERTAGRFSFDPFNRENLRRVMEFVAFAEARPEWFHVRHFPERERIPMGREEPFLRFLLSNAADFLPGDMVFVGGYVPWDPKKIAHYHSFFVFESDPVTGMPLVIAGNAGTPTLRSWTTEMRRTPKRTLRFRVRAHAEWLERVVAESEGEPEPLPMAFGALD